MGNTPSAVPVNSWYDACMQGVMASNLTKGFVDQYGHTINGTFSDQVWGISCQVCEDMCGRNKIYQVFSFTSFSGAFTNWLLPWLALAAQLPYQASGPGSNIMSGLLAIGSPALITYSLSLTILNTFHLRRRLSRLRRESLSVADWAPHLPERITAIATLLQDAQQVPMRVSQENGWLSSLIMLRENQPFWRAVKKDLRNTRQSSSASLFAQLFMASVAFVFSVISTFNADNGSTTVALQIVSGCMWIWMIPVIIGWTFMGIQSSGAIEDALQAEYAKTFRALPTAKDGKFILMDRQQGITVYPSWLKDGHLPEWFGFSVTGDEGVEGPIYNYSRIFTSTQCAIYMERALSNMVCNIRHNCSSEQKPSWELLSDDNNSRKDICDYLVGSSSQITEYCGLPAVVNTYTPWSSIHSRVWQNIAIASTVALFLQWGTTGPAILMAFLTPTVGLGCRSGGYLLYGIAGTASWLLLTCSSFLSHAVMLREEHARATIASNNPDLSSCSVNKNARILCALTVWTRLCGKAIAVANAGWLLASSILGIVAAFDNCWCETNALSMGNGGWVDLFKNTSITIVSSYWIGGLAFSLITCAACLGFFWLACAGTMEDRH